MKHRTLLRTEPCLFGRVLEAWPASFHLRIDGCCGTAPTTLVFYVGFRKVCIDFKAFPGRSRIGYVHATSFVLGLVSGIAASHLHESGDETVRNQVIVISCRNLSGQCNSSIPQNSLICNLGHLIQAPKSFIGGRFGRFSRWLAPKG